MIDVIELKVLEGLYHVSLSVIFFFFHSKEVESPESFFMQLCVHVIVCSA